MFAVVGPIPSKTRFYQQGFVGDLIQICRHTYHMYFFHILKHKIVSHHCTNNATYLVALKIDGSEYIMVLIGLELDLAK